MEDKVRERGKNEGDGRKEGKNLLRVYSVGHMVKDYSDMREETCCCHYMGYSFRLMHITAFVTPFVEHWLE